MYCPEKLKLNKFKVVAIPSPRSYMERFGAHDMPISQYTGEDAPVDFNNRKTDLLHDAQEEMAYRQWLEEENRKQNEGK